MGLHNRPLTLRLREPTGHCFPQETQGNTRLLSAASHFHYQPLLSAFFASCFLSPPRKFPLLHIVTESYYICDAGRPPHYLVRTQVLLILHRNQTHIQQDDSSLHVMTVNWCLLSTPTIVLSTLPRPTRLTFTATLRSQHFYDFQFTDDETKHREVERPIQGHTAGD